MSVNYGGAAYSGGGYAPPGRVNFGWIGQAFELFKANAGVWIIATLMMFIPSIVAAIIGGVMGASGAHQARTGQFPYSTTPYGTSPFGASPLGGANAITGGLPPGLYVSIQIFSVLYSAWLNGGVYRTAVKQVRGEFISIGDIFSGAPLMWKMLGFSIVYGLASGVGFVFCLVPGFLVAGLLFPGYALIADGETVGNAISRSMEAMKQDMWNAAAFVFVISLVLLAGVIPCGLGLFVTMPMFFLTAALAYRDMIGMPGITGSIAGTPAGYGAAQPGVWPPPPESRPPAFGQTPSWGQPPAAAQPPPDLNPLPPPRPSLGGDDLDNDGRPT